MYNEEQYFEKSPSKMTEEEAKQAAAYWRGKFESEQGKSQLKCPLEHFPPLSPTGDAPFHFHNGSKCYQNPCVYC